MLCSGFERASPLGPKAQEGEAVPGLLTWFKKMGLEAPGVTLSTNIEIVEKTHFQWWILMDILPTIVNENGRNMCQQQMSGAKRWVHRSWRKSWRIWTALLRPSCSLFHAAFDITDILKMLGLGDASRGDRNLEEAFAQDCDSWLENVFRALPMAKAVWICTLWQCLTARRGRVALSNLLQRGEHVPQLSPGFLARWRKSVLHSSSVAAGGTPNYMSSIRQMFTVYSQRLYILQDAAIHFRG